jgi:hypothetical protein
MQTETLRTRDAVDSSDGSEVPIVTAKKAIDAPSSAPAPGSNDEHNAAEIARLTGWISAGGGEPLLAD